jgi:hypothetical protein
MDSVILYRGNPAVPDTLGARSRWDLSDGLYVAVEGLSSAVGCDV